MTKTILHKAESRGHANHGWLDSHHTFSFAGYHDQSRVHFGVLRVLNDDIIQGGMGFGEHPHDNMEIISIPIYGALAHKDSMGSASVIHAQDVQVMSAGTGVFHSEFNAYQDKDANFLQIWIFPDTNNVTPRYDQKTFESEDRRNTIQQVVSPFSDKEGLHIHQDAWLSLADLDKDFELNYTIKKKGNGLYIFIIEGDLTINNENLTRRDGLGIWDTEQVMIRSTSASKILLLDVPMSL